MKHKRELIDDILDPNYNFDDFGSDIFEKGLGICRILMILVLILIQLV